MGIIEGATGGAVVAIVLKAIDKYSKELAKFEKTIKRQAGGMEKLNLLLTKTGLGYAAAAVAAGKFALDSIKMAIKSELAFQQFNVVLGETADLFVRDLRKASKGLVSDFQLVDAANRAMALSIDKNQLPELMEIAAARGKVFGRTVPEAFNDITLGIGRQSRLILDNIGIVVNLTEAYAKYAEQIGKTVESLSTFERKQALTNQVIEDSQAILSVQPFLNKTNAESIQDLTAKWNNLKMEVGLFILKITELGQAQSLISQDIRDGITAELFDLEAQLKNSTKEIEGFVNSAKEISKLALGGERAATAEIAQINKEIADQKVVIRGLSNEDQLTVEVVKEKNKLVLLEKEKTKKQEIFDASFTQVKKLAQANANVQLEELGFLNVISEGMNAYYDELFTNMKAELQLQQDINAARGSFLGTVNQQLGDLTGRNLDSASPFSPRRLNPLGSTPAGFTINIENINARDGEDAAIALKNELKNTIGGV